MNKVILVGNLCRDPEITSTPNGISLCKFSIAVQRSFSNANGEREADFINIITWRALAENCSKYLSKGKKVAVSGSIQTCSYDDNEGNKRYRTDVVAEDVEFLSPKDSEATAPPQTPTNAKKKSVNDLTPVEHDDGLLF